MNELRLLDGVCPVDSGVDVSLEDDLKALPVARGRVVLCSCEPVVRTTCILS